jgi:hypothetical protein
MARARCGNRISEVPREPVRPSEPPADLLDRPVFPRPPELTTDLISPPVWVDNSTPFLVAMETRPGRPVSSPFWAEPPFYFPLFGPRPPKANPEPPPIPPPPLPGPGTWPTPIPVGAPPPAVTLEPSALLQFVIGLAVALVVIKLRR